MLKFVRVFLFMGIFALILNSGIMSCDDNDDNDEGATAGDMSGDTSDDMSGDTSDDMSGDTSDDGMSGGGGEEDFNTALATLTPLTDLLLQATGGSCTQCAVIEALLGAFIGGGPNVDLGCENDGTNLLSIVSGCAGGTELTIQTNQTNCLNENGDLITGISQSTFIVDASGVQVVTVSDDYNFNGLSYMVNFTATTPCDNGQTGTTTCVGTMNTDSASCDVSSDCTVCE